MKKSYLHNNARYRDLIDAHEVDISIIREIIPRTIIWIIGYGVLNEQKK